MPPRFAYWTILIDNKATAFRAREREELLPTLHQLRRKNADVALKWFARGTLWDSPEAARAAQEAPKAPSEKRSREWRPGGEHKDPRARFDKKKVHKPHRFEKPEGARPWSNKPPASGGRERRPWSSKPPGAGSGERRPWSSKPPGAGSGERRPWSSKPPGAGSGERRPWSSKPPGAGSGERRPWSRRPPAPRKPKPPEDE